MSLRLPLLIGISGKRIFDKESAAEDAKISQWVEQRFKAIFDKLEAEYPETPKIVLTGAAFGADMIAADAALDMKSPSWAVAAILPFDRKLFEEDFRQGPDDPHGPGWTERFLEHEKKFASLMKAGDNPAKPGVLVRELPKLYVEPPTKTNPAGVVATVEQLTRQNGQFRALRDNHYEQVGQFIAESSTIMIAVMPGDGPADGDTANGGTARVVAYRRAGRADTIGTAVAEHSKVLRSEWSDLVAPPAGFVWLIDVQSFPAENEVDGLSFKVLPPLLDRSTAETYANEPARAMPKEDLHHHTTPWLGIGSERQVRASLVLAAALKRFHGQFKENSTVAADISATSDLPQQAERVRELINGIQIEKNKASRRAFTWLACLFVAAILSFEIWAKFHSDYPYVLSVYILVLSGIGVVVYRARVGRWQAISDDYRAVAEMLRVQEAWWSAGIRERVDREHLQGVDRSLARIRDVATTLIAWLVLRRGWSTPLRPHWKNVIDGWIGGQLNYFSRKAVDREDMVLKTDAASWTLFVTSGYLALFVFVWLVHHHAFFYKFKAIADWGRSAIPRVPFLDIGVAVSVLLWLALAYAMFRYRVYRRDAEGIRDKILTFGFGFLIACCIAFAAASLMPLTEYLGYSEEEGLTKIKSGVAVLLVAMSAVAGALRYRTERLNVEAEAHEYHDAHQRFERAKRAIVLNDDGTPADLHKAARLVHELGRMALIENEAWLKSRRERPLTPVVG